jgi:hypothetical protein
MSLGINDEAPPKARSTSTNGFGNGWANAAGLENREGNIEHKHEPLNLSVTERP